MSFPHRTAFYDRKKGEIRPPESGLANFHSENGQDIYDILSEELCGAKYIPLASTGLEDSEDNEIFEGHIVEFVENKYSSPNRYESYNNAIVVWGTASFYLQAGNKNNYHMKDMSSIFTMADPNINGKIIGHGLTNPDLVPLTFDVEEYFDGY